MAENYQAMIDRLQQAAQRAQGIITEARQVQKDLKNDRKEHLELMAADKRRAETALTEFKEQILDQIQKEVDTMQLNAQTVLDDIGMQAAKEMVDLVTQEAMIALIDFLESRGIKGLKDSYLNGKPMNLAEAALMAKADQVGLTNGHSAHSILPTNVALTGSPPTLAVNLVKVDHRKSDCPNCGEPIDPNSALAKGKIPAPKDGDWSYCAKCEKASIFTGHKLDRRVATVREIKTVAPLVAESEEEVGMEMVRG